MVPVPAPGIFSVASRFVSVYVRVDGCHALALGRRFAHLWSRLATFGSIQIGFRPLNAGFARFSSEIELKPL